MQTLPGPRPAAPRGAWEAPRSAETGFLEIWASPRPITKTPGGQANPGPRGPPPRQAHAAQPMAGPVQSGSCLAPGPVPSPAQRRDNTSPNQVLGWGWGQGTSQWRHREGPCECRETAEAGDLTIHPHHPPLSPSEIHGQNGLSAPPEAKHTWAGTQHPLPSISEPVCCSMKGSLRTPTARDPGEQLVGEADLFCKIF